MLNYGPNENRKWTVNTDCDSVNVDVVKFDTEEFFDYLHIDDEKFSGADYTFQVNLNLKRFFNMLGNGQRRAPHLCRHLASEYAIFGRILSSYFS